MQTQAAFSSDREQVLQRGSFSVTMTHVAFYPTFKGELT